MYIVEGKDPLNCEHDNYFVVQEYEADSDGNMHDEKASFVTCEGAMADAFANETSDIVKLAPYIGGEILDYGFDIGGWQLKLAAAEGLTHYAFWTELLWKENGRPYFRSDDQHMVFGCMTEGPEGQEVFDPFVTILSYAYYSGA